DELAREYSVPPAELPERIRELQERAKARQQAAPSTLPDLADVLARAEKRDGAYVIVERIDDADATALRELGDALRQRAKSAAIALGTVIDGKPAIAIMLTDDRVEAGLNAGKLAKRLGKEMGAGGGGRPDSATAGGRNASSLDAGLALAKKLLGGDG
ncbi:MAG: alanine--tRNA ligase, partial [Chloroflexi bacterium]|nr:alanine--tRNA ligase [Chloroflexota bacterium]